MSKYNYGSSNEDRQPWFSRGIFLVARIFQSRHRVIRLLKQVCVVIARCDCSGLFDRRTSWITEDRIFDAILQSQQPLGPIKHQVLNWVIHSSPQTVIRKNNKERGKCGPVGYLVSSHTQTSRGSAKPLFASKKGKRALLVAFSHYFCALMRWWRLWQSQNN